MLHPKCLFSVRVHTHAYGNLISINSIGVLVSFILPCVHCAVQHPLFKTGSVNNHSALYANLLSEMNVKMCPG